jgi:hypothetical protein
VEGFFFLWLPNCIWLYHIPHLWHLEQRTFEKYWDNCLYQLVYVEDPPCTTSSLHLHTCDPSRGWHVLYKSITGLISEYCSLGCTLVYVNMFHLTALILFRLWQCHLNCCQESRGYVTLWATVTDCNSCCLY